MAEAVGGKNGTVKRQHIEQLEAAGNRQPRYLGQLAAAMGTTADDMLAEAGLAPKRSRRAPAPPAGPLVDRLREERDVKPYDLIERGLDGLLVVSHAKDEVLALIRKHAETAADLQRAFEERLRQQQQNPK